MFKAPGIVDEKVTDNGDFRTKHICRCLYQMEKVDEKVGKSKINSEPDEAGNDELNKRRVGKDIEKHL